MSASGLVRSVSLPSGWSSTEVFWTRDEVRKNLYRILKKRTKHGPKLPLPHGKINDYFWNYLPDSLLISPEEFFRTLLTCPEWWIISESPRQSVFKLDVQSSHLAELPQEDVFLVPAEFAGPILVLDHEGMGPWLIGDGDRPTILRSPAPSSKSSIFVDGVCLDEAKVQALRKLVLKRIRNKDIYIPTSFSRNLRVRGDNLWNYLPEVFDTELAVGSLPIELIESAEQVMTWTDNDRDFRLFSDVTREQLLQFGDAYYLEWPLARWLLAVPHSFITMGSESWVLPSFVVLE